MFILDILLNNLNFTPISYTKSNHFSFHYSNCVEKYFDNEVLLLLMINKHFFFTIEWLLSPYLLCSQSLFRSFILLKLLTFPTLNSNPALLIYITGLARHSRLSVTLSEVLEDEETFIERLF